MKKKQLALAYEINNSCFEGYLKKIKNDIKNVGADDILIFSNDITNEKKHSKFNIFTHKDTILPTDNAINIFI